MDQTFILLLSVAGFLVGGGIGFALRRSLLNKQEKEILERNERIMEDAKNKSRDLLQQAKNESHQLHQEMKKEEMAKRDQLDKLEDRLVKKEESIDKKSDQLDKMKEDLEQKVHSAKAIKEEVEKMHAFQAEKLQKIAAMSQEEARQVLLKKVEEEAKDDLLIQMRKAEQELKANAQEKARYMIADAIQRLAAEVTAESTTTIVNLPSDDLKGRIIGREGRNINTFEQITGIDVIVDDTPGSIIISGFDMIRRYIAKITLERLITDGRIHPARIEETYDKVREEVNGLIKELGEKAVYETGVTGLHPNLIKLLGRLKFRISHGQNVLKHSIEVAFLAASLASELGANIEVCRKGGLLHDIGKAVDHEIQGHHAKIGAEIGRKFGLQQDVIHCIESHEGQIEPQSVEAMIIEAANLISNFRPGANQENLDTFIRRMQELENLCNSFEGVKKSFAVQSGNQVRIFVNSDLVDDLGSARLGHNIARKIEKDFQHPAPIKVNMIREVRKEAVAD
ncbi:MAG: ribonuclease Y [Patescibacteria group bacterium]